jgi:phosphinothricin acetyltransferase
MATPDDAEACLAIYAPVVRDTVISFETVPPALAEMRERIASNLEYAPWLVYEEDGLVLGYAYASKFRPRLAYRWAVEGSYYFAPEARGKGLGFATASLLHELLRLQGFQSVYDVIALPNPASERLSEKLGKRRVGVLPKAGFKLGQWVDVAYWHMELSPTADSPVEPGTMEERSAMPEWQAAMARAVAPPGARDKAGQPTL